MKSSLAVLHALVSTGAVAAFAPPPIAPAAAAARRVPSSLASTPFFADIATTTRSAEATVEPFIWNGHSIHAESCGPSTGQPVLLVHGFGCSTTYWRETTAALAQEGYNVHAIDLLGQGKSAKPGSADDIYYSINLWANIVDDYAREVIGSNDDVILMGNSLGSLVALAAAVGDHSDDDTAYLAAKSGRVRGICMFNCGVGLNSRNIIDEPQWTVLQRFLLKSFFGALDALLFDNPPVLRYVLSEVVTPDLLKGALQGLYRKNPDRVDDELVMSFYHPAKDVGAPEALGQIYTNDPGLSPMQIHDKYADRFDNLPIHLVWGDDDAVTPITGGVGRFYSNLSRNSDSPVTMDVVAGTGHVPFDDNPIESQESMLRWLKTLTISPVR